MWIRRFLSDAWPARAPSAAWRRSVSRVVQPILDRLLDLFSLVFGFFPSGIAVPAVILIRVEGQKTADQDRENDYNCGPHVFMCATLRDD